jgi:hypothetical protein
VVAVCGHEIHGRTAEGEMERRSSRGERIAGGILKNRN